MVALKPHADPSSPKYEVKMEFGVQVSMRDGVRLSSFVFRPDAEGRFPVILQRTPYSGSIFEGPPAVPREKTDTDRARYFARRGYAYVLQDCRGTNDSEGTFYPWEHEAEDGYDTQEWCGTRPWSNGSVGTIGESYEGGIQWLAALLQNKHLKAMVSIAPGGYTFLGNPYRNGALGLYLAAWAHISINGRRNHLMYPYGNLAKLLRHLPLMEMEDVFGRRSGWWKDFVKHSSYDDYWKRYSYHEKLERVQVPVLHVSGWYDTAAIGDHLNFIGMVQRGGSELARRNQRLIVGPWTHSSNPWTRIAPPSPAFGPGAVIDLDGVIAQWFDRWLKGIETRADEDSPVSIYVMGDGKWRDEMEWPLARTVHTKYFLHSNGRANTVDGDGGLSAEMPIEEAPDIFTFDPENPVPELAPPLFSSDALFGAEDQRSVETRQDVLVYTTDRLTDDVEITGRVWVQLFAASTARDTDFTAKLVDVQPDGYAMRLWDGIVRARFRESLENPTLIEPGRVYEYPIDLWFTSNVFRRDHRIRLEISSSKFPQFDRNPNTGNTIGTDRETMTARQTVLHDASHPSHILLPIIPR